MGQVFRCLIFFGFGLLSIMTSSIYSHSKGGAGADLDFSSMGYSASSLAVSESNGAQINNAYSGFYNPAGLNGLSQCNAYSLQGNIGDGVGLYSMGISAPVSQEWAFSLNWVQIQVSDIGLIATENASLNTDLSATTFSQYSANGVTAALAYSFDRDFSLGLAMTVFSKSFSNIADSGGSGISFTPGMTMALSDTLNLGIYAKNIISYVTWQTGTEETMGRWINVGLAYEWYAMTFFSELDSPLESGGAVLKLAGDYKWNSIITFRGGYTAPPGWNMQTENPLQVGRLTVGLGLNLEFVNIDYAYVGGNDSRYSDSSRVSIGCKF